MTRQADPKATGYFSVKARNESEHQLIGDLKRLACQDDLELTDLIFEGIREVFKNHNWPPGNPQTQLTNYQQTELSQVEKCKCGRLAVVWANYVASKEEHRFCQTCFSRVPLRFDPKVWKLKSS